MNDEELIKLLESLKRPIALEWQIFLDDEQIKLKRELERSILDSESFVFHLVLGGAGTGKTQVLLNLAETLTYSGLSVYFKPLEHVAKRITDAGLDLPSNALVPQAVHVIDDPSSFNDLVDAYDLSVESGARALIVAVDPLQWTEKRALIRLTAMQTGSGEGEEVDARISEIVYEDEIWQATVPEVHYLKTSYRQSADTGQNAINLSKQIYSQLQPFVLEDRVHQFAALRDELAKAILDDVRHTREGGTFVFENTNSTESLWRAIARAASRTDRWDWTESLLFVSDNNRKFGLSWELDEPWSRHQIQIPGVSDKEDFDQDSTLYQILAELDAKIVDFEDPESVRGLEFQDVIIALSIERWEKFHRKASGMDARVWRNVAPVHTFITRAVDNLTVLFFGLPSITWEE